MGGHGRRGAVRSAAPCPPPLTLTLGTDARGRDTRTLFSKVDASAKGSAGVPFSYDTSKTSIGGGFKVGDLVAFGADGSYTRKESDVRNPRYLTPDGWREWVSCAG